jgi:hypothetical protein
MNTATTTISSSLGNLYINISSPNVAANADEMVDVSFNDDGGTNYGYLNINNGTKGTPVNGAQSFKLIDGVNTTSPYRADIYVGNVAGARKFAKWTEILSGTGAVAPIVTEGIGVWNNTSSLITSFQVKTGGGHTIPAGTVIKIYGY